MADAEYDVIVAGAGNAALVAALAAREQGARVLVLEKAPPQWRGGNSYFTTGVFRVAIKNAQEAMFKIMPQMSRDQIESFVVPDYSRDQMYNDHMQLTEGMADPEQLELVVKESVSILEWMAKQGFMWEPRISPLTVKKEGKMFFPGNGLLFQARGGGAGLSDQGFDLVGRNGVELRYNTKVLNLLRDARGGVAGVVAQSKEGIQNIKSKGVILGCGGFEANPAMRAQYLGKNWDLAKVRGTPYNTGDMLKAVLDHGAAPIGHWGGCHAVFIDAESPQPADRAMLDRTRRVSNAFGIVVNSKGERFMDEGEDRFDLVYAKSGQYCLQQPHLTAYQIFDSKGREILEEYYLTGRCVEADCIQELAEVLEIDQGGFAQTIEEFNAAAHESKEFTHVRKDGNSTVGIKPAKSNWARKIDTPPYVAYATCCGITFTYGGIQVNRESQVLNTEGEVIQGLYACGEIVGGLFYHNYPGGTGLTRGAVMGRIAGYNAAAQ